MEPFQDSEVLDQLKRRLGFDNIVTNASSKIWLFSKRSGTGKLWWIVFNK